MLRKIDIRDDDARAIARRHRVAYSPNPIAVALFAYADDDPDAIATSLALARHVLRRDFTATDDDADDARADDIDPDADAVLSFVPSTTADDDDDCRAVVDTTVCRRMID